MRALLVPRQVQAVEVREAVPALHVINAQPDLLVPLVLVVVEVSEVEFADAARQSFRRNLRPLRLGHEGLTAAPHAEHARGLDVIPLLFQERVTSFLLGALFTTLRQPLVLANRHSSPYHLSFTNP